MIIMIIHYHYLADYLDDEYEPGSHDWCDLSSKVELDHQCEIQAARY